MKKTCHRIEEPEWKREFRTLRRRKDKLEDHQYDALIGIANSPFIVADDVSEALDLLEEMNEVFKHRYDKKIGCQRQNATLMWLAGVNHNRIMEDMGL